MNTVTTREAQHHLSKVLKMVDSGEEVIITRRWKKVARLTPCEDEPAVPEKVDWATALAKIREELSDIPSFDYGIVEAMREEDERF